MGGGGAHFAKKKPCQKDQTDADSAAEEQDRDLSATVPIKPIRKARTPPIEHVTAGKAKRAEA